MTTRISVIIPVYNSTTYLPQTIDSVAGQDYPEVEIIVVDDGSHEEGAAAIRSACHAYPDVRLIRQDNGGPAQARWAGVRRATGEYVHFLDSDDVLLPGALTHLVQVLHKNPRAVAAYGRKAVMNKHGVFKPQQVLPTESQAASGNILPALLKGLPILTPGNICIRTAALTSDMFQTNLRQGEDWITWCRLALTGDVLYAGKRVVMCYREHGANSSRAVQEDDTPLAEMLDTVFGDARFTQRLGSMPMSLYRVLHEQTIRRFLLAKRSRRTWWHYSWARLYIPKIPKNDRIRVLHVVKHFYAGGAERLISSVLAHSDPTRYEHIILSLSDNNERIGTIEARQNIPCHMIDVDRTHNRMMQYLSCLLFIRAVRPDMIKTWLPPANIAGGIMARLLGIPVVWGIHDAQPPRAQPAITRWQVPLARLIPKRIVCCSELVRQRCLQAGYRPQRLQVIENGVDSEVFRHSADGRIRIRRELGVSDQTLLIGMAAEYTPVKRHGFFFAAARAFLVQHPNTRFVLCGQFTHPSNRKLENTLTMFNLHDAVHLLGVRNDMPEIYSAMDIHTLTSHTESFGLAVAEATACGTLCVATDTGIAHSLLDNVGYIIPVTEDVSTLVQAWQHMAALPRHTVTECLTLGRKRIQHEYSIQRTAHQYDEVYSNVL
ncbi:MAG: glycosyltransferase [Alphaproteobacteria bacterium]